MRRIGETETRRYFSGILTSVDARDTRRKLIDLDKAIVEKQGFAGFIRCAWTKVESTPLVWNWHIEEMAAHLEAVSKGQIRNLIINVPPGSMKSLTVSVFWPVWDWIKDPERRFIFGSYGAKLVHRDAKRSQSLLQSTFFTDRWGRRINPNDPTGFYYSEQGGFRFSTTVRGEVTGHHADRHVIDDPLKPLDTNGAALATSLEWWNETMSTRVRDPKTIGRVIIMQRLHEGDLAGEMLKRGDYVHLKLPMRFDSSRRCVTLWGGDRRKEDGELLTPRMDHESLKKLERDLGPNGTAAQLDQEPNPVGGAIFNRDWFQHYDAPPSKFDEIIQSWDMSFKAAEDSDFVACTVWGRKGANYYLLFVLNERLSFPNTLLAVERVTSTYTRCFVKLVEDKANGPAIISMLKDKISGLVPVTPEGGKVARANAVAGLYEAGNIWHPRSAPWLEEYEAQLVKFPRGKNDDMVDATTQALTYLFQHHSYLEEAMAQVRKSMVGSPA